MSVICYHAAAIVADEESYRNPLDRREEKRREEKRREEKRREDKIR